MTTKGKFGIANGMSGVGGKFRKAATTGLLAGAVVLAALAVTPSRADAQVRVGVGVSFGGPVVAPYSAPYRYYAPPPPPAYYRPPVYPYGYAHPFHRYGWAPYHHVYGGYYR